MINRPMRLVTGIYAIWLREVKRAIRDRGQLIGGVSRPLMWVLIMGIGLNPISVARCSARSALRCPTPISSSSSRRSWC